MDQLLEAANCPVCLGRLTPPLICCVNGHAICGGCKGRQTTCPICRQQFSLAKVTALTKLIETLPMYCKHLGCKELSWNIKMHEELCELKPFKCRVCEWNGPLKDLYSHLNSSIHEINTNCSIPIRDYKNFSIFDVWKIRGQYFWRTVKNDVNLSTISIQFHCLPKRSVFTIEVEKDCWVKVEVKAGHVEYNAKLKVSFKCKPDDSEDNIIVFNNDAIKSFISKGGLPTLTCFIENNNCQPVLLTKASVPQLCPNFGTSYNDNQSTQHYYQPINVKRMSTPVLPHQLIPTVPSVQTTKRPHSIKIIDPLTNRPVILDKKSNV